jgi:4-amino-4-deoxy-L-arabinose transferase-like glycosyltransferase
MQVMFLFLVVALGVGIRLAVIPWADNSPYPPVDIYYADTQAAQVVLNLQNPYIHTYMIHGNAWDLYAYLPMVPFFYAPFYLLGDIRYGSIFADVIIMFALYSVSKSLSKRDVYAVFAPFVYAILPMSIWLTSATGSNMMIGTAFLMLFLVTLLKEKYAFAALFLGLGMATNQFVAALLPFFGYYLWTKRKRMHILGAVAVSAAVILPFAVANASKFIYGIFTFQLDRPLQLNGPFSFFSIVYSTWGVQPSFLVRGGMLVAALVISLFAFGRERWLFVPLTGLLLCLGAFLIPVNGFWNYFLPAITIVCALIPPTLNRIEELTGIHWF